MTFIDPVMRQKERKLKAPSIEPEKKVKCIKVMTERDEDV